MRIAEFVALKQMALPYYTKIKTSIDLDQVYSCAEDGYGDQRGNHPAVKVIGAFGELLLDVSYREFAQYWEAD